MRLSAHYVLLLLLGLLSACARQMPTTDDYTPNTGHQQKYSEAPQEAAADSSFTPAPTTANRNPHRSERLGTQWGDEVDSYVTQVDLRRVSETPLAEASLRYADKTYTGRAISSLSMAAGKIEWRVETDNGSLLPMFRDSGRYYLKGQAGQAYRLVYNNNSDKTYEIVASVDGLDVLNGRSASRYNDGYVLSPNSRLVIEGFRKNNSAVASFIFSKPKDAYVANTPQGDVRNTGIIGTVVYELYDPSRPKRPVRPYQGREPNAFPSDSGYAPAPR